MIQSTHKTKNNATTTRTHPQEGILYHVAIKDLYSNMIVGTASSDHQETILVLNALTMAITHRKPLPGLILHSDRGGQFRSQAYKDTLTQYGIHQSMGNTGSSADNASMESYFALLQKNVLNLHQNWASREKLAHAIFYWTYHDYNRRRRQQHLNGLTPTEYEKITPAAKAA